MVHIAQSCCAAPGVCFSLLPIPDGLEVSGYWSMVNRKRKAVILCILLRGLVNRIPAPCAVAIGKGFTFTASFSPFPKQMGKMERQIYIFLHTLLLVGPESSRFHLCMLTPGIKKRQNKSAERWDSLHCLVTERAQIWPR